MSLSRDTATGGNRAASVNGGEPLLGWRAKEMLELKPEKVDWLVPGLLVAGWTTKLAAREKTGKGTFAYYVLGCLERGEDTAFGASAQATAVILTEEPHESSAEKLRLFRIERARVILGYLMAGWGWQEKVATLVKAIRVEGHGLVFIDNISRASGVEDESGTELARAIEHLADEAKKAGAAVLIDHHHKKGQGAIEDESRGSTSIAGATDINVEMVRVGGRGSRSRKLVAQGRLRACNWQRVVELSEDGRSYVTADDGAEPDSDVQRAFMDRLSLGEMGGHATVAQFKDKIGLNSQSAARERLKAIASPLPETVGTGRTAIYRLVEPVGEPTS